MRRLHVNTDTRTIELSNFDLHYSTDAFVNAASYDFHHSVWKHREPQATVIHTCGTVLAIVFPEYYAWSEQDALDEAADSGKLDSLLVSESELKDYEVGKDSEGHPDYEGIINLGNASEPFDSQNLEYFTVDARLFATDPVIVKVIEENPAEE